VWITPRKPLSGLTVNETLVELEKLTDRYVRNHKGEERKKPYPPNIHVSLVNGVKIKGTFCRLSENSLTVDHFRVDVYVATTVVDIKNIVSVSYAFPRRIVEMRNIS
jgi:hypothetical protein